jgi:ESCRT-II complex subunit VPS36
MKPSTILDDTSAGWLLRVLPGSMLEEAVDNQARMGQTNRSTTVVERTNERANEWIEESHASRLTMSSSTGTAWSPFTCLPKATLTPSGLLQLETQDQEVELIRRGPLELRHEGDGTETGTETGTGTNHHHPMAPCPHDCSGYWESRSSDLTMTVTTHRIVWFNTTTTNDHDNDDNTPNNNNNKKNKKKNEARFLHLSNIHQVQASGGASMRHWNASYKLIVSTYTYGDLLLAFRSSGSSSEDRDACQHQLDKALERRAWEMATRLQHQQQASASVAPIRRRVGVDHILTKNKLKHQTAKKLTDDALSGDADQLLQEAAALLQVIQKYVALLAKKQPPMNTTDGSSSTTDNDNDSNSNSNNNNNKADVEKLGSLLQDMGMTSALTKSQVSNKAGGGSSHKKGNGQPDEYIELIARQVADFLLPKLPQMGGIVCLTDVFCLFNRARGTNLISPEDLRQACQLLGDLQLGLSQRTFPSGIVVVQLDDLYDTRQQGDRLVALCPTTALEASPLLKLSPLLALEQLEDAERQGLLCRDVTLETTRFYPNRFSTTYEHFLANYS